jgi:hypothetical protein
VDLAAGAATEYWCGGAMAGINGSVGLQSAGASTGQEAEFLRRYTLQTLINRWVHNTLKPQDLMRVKTQDKSRMNMYMFFARNFINKKNYKQNDKQAGEREQGVGGTGDTSY